MIRNGFLAILGLFTLYAVTMTALSGIEAAVEQFRVLWYLMLPLVIGFGIQVGLYRELRDRIRGGNGARNVLVVTGANSTVAMISCCAHYLANILPLLGATGLLTLVGQYQIELFWVGLAANLLGIAYITGKIIQFSHRA